MLDIININLVPVLRFALMKLILYYSALLGSYHLYHKDGFNVDIDEKSNVTFVPNPKLQVRFYLLSSSFCYIFAIYTFSGIFECIILSDFIIVVGVKC